MSDKCCGNTNVPIPPDDPCNPPEVSCCSDAARTGSDAGPLAWFGRMIPNCLDYAGRAHADGRPIVGIMCEYAPREIILAAGAVAVCLCGGEADTIPAAEQDLPSNLCPLIKSTYGHHLQKSNPFLEMADLVVAETTCDGKKKMFELMAETRDTWTLELPQKEDDADAFEHWLCELRKFRVMLSERYGVGITDEDLRASIAAMNRERRLRRQLAALMQAESPPFTGLELLQLKSSISAIPADMEKYEEALAYFANRKDAGNLSARVRVLLTGVPVVHGAERIVQLIEDHGGLVVCMESCTGVKPILEDVDESAADPMRAIAEKYLHLPCSVMTRNNRRIVVLRELAQTYRAECVIDLVWQTCLTYDVESRRVRTLAEQELRVPFLHIETDYSPSDSARIATRIEALYETVRHAGACA